MSTNPQGSFESSASDAATMPEDQVRVLNCLVEDIFTGIIEVQPRVDGSLDQLKQLVWEQGRHRVFRGIDVSDLVLLKVNIDLDGIDDKSLRRHKFESGKDTEELKTWKSVLEYWPDQPLKNHLHFVVKVPVTDVVSPKEQVLDIEQLEGHIDEGLKSLRVAVETFLKNPEPPTWVPPGNATPSNYEFLTSLQIPTYRNGRPSLLLHDLDVFDGNEIDRTFNDLRPLYICNTSGSGKTRRILECLTRYWGFYFVAAPDDNGVGIGDLQDALDGLATSHGWMNDLSSLPPEKRADQGRVNRWIASHAFKKVLAARILVFELFLDVAIQVDGSLQEKHKRIWLLFQLFGQLDPRFSTMHPFVFIIENSLCNASAEALDRLIERLDDIRARLPRTHFIVGLDEAQQAIRSYPRSFVSSTNSEVFRTILQEMFKVFTKPPVKFVVSGTDLSLGDLRDGIASGVSKSSESVMVVHQLGMFDTWPKLKKYLERYVPASFLETPSGYSLQHRIREYLLGRYRFSVSFLEHLLMNGLESPHKLFNAYIKEYTTCLPGDHGRLSTMDEPELSIDIKSIEFEWDRLEENPDALQEAVQIVRSHLALTPRFGPVTIDLVGYGIACLREDHKGYIAEALAFLSLMKWLENNEMIRALNL